MQVLDRPVVFGNVTERLTALPASRTIRSRNPALQVAFRTRGRVLVEDRDGELRGVPDDNRSVIFPDVTAWVGGRPYALSVKGTGARTPLYGRGLFSAIGPSDGGRLHTDETWLGESPYGAQGEVPVARGLEVTDLGEGCCLNGFYFCPIVEANEFPPPESPRPHWYRRHRGAHFQEQRLVPSNVRLYHHSNRTLGQHPREVLGAFGVESRESLEAFLANYLASGVAALTLFARTARRTGDGIAGLKYADVWLDKDCLLAPDGTLHFADLEGLWRDTARGPHQFEEFVREQFDRTFYEFMFGADLLLGELEALGGRPWDQAQRRNAMISRTVAALEGDAFVHCEEGAAGLSLAIRALEPSAGALSIPMIDLR